MGKSRKALDQCATLGTDQVKLCRKCRRTLPISDFGSDSQKYDGKCWWCKECAEKARQYRMELRREGRSIGLTKATTEELLNELRYRLLWQEEVTTR